jgi:alpha-L-rhamnosidase
VTGLKVDQIDRPLGLENPKPRLSWRLESLDRGVRQSAYRILVASREELLQEGQGDVWDSGKVPGRKSIGIRYAGTELASRQHCWWCVQVWDERGEPSGYSDSSGWEMGLLSAHDWQGQWLAVEDAVAKVDRQVGLRWIWGPAVPDETSRQFRLRVQLPADSRQGMLLVGGKDRLAGVWVDGQHKPIDAPAPYAIGQPLQQIILGALASGEHVFAVEVRRREDEVRAPAGAMTAFIRLELKDGRTLRISKGFEWRTHNTEEPHWFTPEFDDASWEPARLLADDQQPWPPAPAMHLRKAFMVETAPAQSRLYVTALGAYEATLNGRRVGDALLTPESNDFRKRALYRTYDVTDGLQKGSNVLGFTVGDGWYASTQFMLGRYAWGIPPRRVLAQLEMTFSDGTRRTVATSPGWRIAGSSIVRSEIYDGETQDARLSQPGWDANGFDESHWESAEAADKPQCQLSAQVSPAIRAVATLKPHVITAPAANLYVVDFGQNFAGWCRLRTKGAAGTRIEMQFAETLLASGEVDRSNLRGAKQTDVFILRGDSSEEVFEPKFTYHGFRYVQISGLLTAPTADSIEGIVIHSDLPMTGKLRIGNALIQQIWSNTLWTQRSNLMGVPTDCPQRDERYGFLADASIFWDAAAFNMDVAAFTRRHMQSAADSQDSGGAYPPIVPYPHSQIDAVPAWADGGVILPWTVWRRYGDSTIIEENWEGMHRYLRLIQQNNPDYLWRNCRMDIGDWLAVDQQYETDPTTPHELIGTAYWAHSVDLLSQMADAIGRSEDAGSLRSLHERIRVAFASTFVKADGRVGNESQTSFVLALKFGLVADDVRVKAAERLVADIRRRGRALSTGILGTQFLLDVLADAGYASLAYDLLLRTAYPSWGYMIEHGATTIWESWNGRVWNVASEGMPDSKNHYALGAICGFLFRRIAGIAAATPGFETILIQPALDPRIMCGGGDYDSVMGRISTNWKQTSDGRFMLNVNVPANATACIHIPFGPDSRIEESGKETFLRRDIRIIERRDQMSLIEVGSGNYHFSVAK